MSERIRAGEMLEYYPYLPNGNEMGVVGLVVNVTANKPCLICVHEILNPKEVNGNYKTREEWRSHAISYQDRKDCENTRNVDGQG